MTEKKKCFVIAPIGAEESTERRRSFRVFKNIIEPAAAQCEYFPLSARDIPGSGLIMSEVIKEIVSAPLVIADLTGGNANVFYELALRHAVGMPVVQIIAKEEKIEFDVSQLRTIRFDIDDVIDNVNSKNETIDKLVEYIRGAEKNSPPLETPVSAVRVTLWTPFPESEKASPITEVPSPAVKHIDDVVEILESMPRAEAVPAIIKYIEDLTKDPRVHLLERPIDDLDAACTLVNGVPEGGYISATSSLQNEDADEYEAYRTAVNRALERNVTYRKVICSSPELWTDRHQKWLKEFTDKAELIKEGKIKPDAFQLLHYPAPMSVDVLISRDIEGECQEMVAGFAGGGGQHGGFRADDKRMVEEWQKIYLEAKIIAEAEVHTKRVLTSAGKCRCLEFLKLLEDARQAASQPKAVDAEAAPETDIGEE
jgi:hypothetical protein